MQTSTLPLSDCNFVKFTATIDGGAFVSPLEARKQLIKAAGLDEAGLVNSQMFRHDCSGLWCHISVSARTGRLNGCYF